MPHPRLHLSPLSPFSRPRPASCFMGCLVLLLFGAALQTASANLVQNSNFGTAGRPSLSPGWTEGEGNGSFPIGVPSPCSDNSVAFQNGRYGARPGGSISQAVGGFTVGSVYSFSFYFAGDIYCQEYSSTANCTFEFFFTPPVSGLMPPFAPDLTYPNFKQFSFTFTATATTHTLNFTGSDEYNGPFLAHPVILPGSSTISGCQDPHFSLATGSTEEFTFDFHGLMNKTYCMVADYLLQLNVLMVGAPSGIAANQETPENEQEFAFFDGTYMGGLGAVYLDSEGRNQSIAICLNQTANSDGDQLLYFVYNKESIDLGPQSAATWTNPDGSLTITRASDPEEGVTVLIAGLVEMDITTSLLQQVDPPLHYINFGMNWISSSPQVHGFLGQMLAPGAVEERLAMGTLEGLNHREYVDGTDDEYETSGLIAADCSFSRLGEAFEHSTVGSSSTQGTSRRKLLGVPTNGPSPSASCQAQLEGNLDKGFRVTCK